MVISTASFLTAVPSFRGLSRIARSRNRDRPLKSCHTPTDQGFCCGITLLGFGAIFSFELPLGLLNGRTDADGSMQAHEFAQLAHVLWVNAIGVLIAHLLGQFRRADEPNAGLVLAPKYDRHKQN